MGLTPAPTNLWGLAWIALAPLWVLVVDGMESGTGKVNLWIPFVWGVGYHGLAFAWIRGLHPLTWMGLSRRTRLKTKPNNPAQVTPRAAPQRVMNTQQKPVIATLVPQDSPIQVKGWSPRIQAKANP